MNEIEVKILDVDRSAVEKKLLAMGATKIFDDEIYAESFDKEGLIRANDHMFRVRKEGTRVVVTFKGPKQEGAAKIREEIEVEIGDFEKMLTILERLGYKSEHQIRKHRVSYKLPDVQFDFDDYMDDLAFIPEFLEIEAGDIPTIHRYAVALGFQKEDCTPYSLPDVVTHYV